jgi:two-component system LytT family sensor kinase
VDSDLPRGTAPRPLTGRTVRFTLIAAAWLALWGFVLLLFAARVQALYILSNEVMPWGRALAASTADWLPWLAFGPAIVWLSLRLPLSRRHAPRALLVHLPAALAITTLHALLRPALARAAGLSGKTSFAVAFLMLMQFDFMLYAALAGITLATQFARRLRERERSAAATELRTVQLEQTLTESRLALLRTQLDPHFLFNTMHAISALMQTDIRAADSMLTKLSDILRASMADTSRHEVPLHEELDFSERYLGIQRARLGDRLRIEMQIHPDVLQGRVPSMLLQPLLENAIRHGIAPRVEGGSLEVAAFAENRQLHIIVRDDGAGLNESFPAGSGGGIGLRNTLLRLRHLYGAAATLDVRRRASGGTEVAVTLPLNVYTTGTHRAVAAVRAMSQTQ